VPATEEPGKADNETTESPEEHENAGGGTDRLYETIQKLTTAMPLLTISSVVLAIVFFMQANRYHNPFMTFLALWFLVLGFQALSLYGLHRINVKLEVHCCDGRYSCVDAILEIILFTILLTLPWGFINAEPILIGKINVVEKSINAITIALTVFFSTIWVLDTVYAISEVMPIIDD
jgi:hypothetical protein